MKEGIEKVSKKYEAIVNFIQSELKVVKKIKHYIKISIFLINIRNQ